MNAKKCGWSGTSKVEEGNDIEANRDANTGDVKEMMTLILATIIPLNPIIQCSYRRGTMSAHDDKYHQDLISIKAYYKLVWDCSQKMFDPIREYLFLLVSTAVCIGLLYCFGIQCLLILWYTRRGWVLVSSCSASYVFTCKFSGIIGQTYGKDEEVEHLRCSMKCSQEY